MSNTSGAAPNPRQPEIYHIRVKGHLAARWEAWFRPLAIILEANGETLLRGPLVDQAELHGILTKIRDLGMPLLSVTYVERDPANEPQPTHREVTP